ncbi:MAG: NAD(P)-binding protein [Bacteroidota bacterium]
MKPIKIIGSGPSGLTAAINLAKAGREVHVYEKNSDVGQRFHGDLEGLENWSHRENLLEQLARMNVSLDFPSHPFCDVTVADGLRSANFHFRRPLFYAVKRGIENDSFDQALKKQAILHGVNFHFKQSLAVTEGDIVATGPIVKEIFAVDKGIVFQTDLPDTAIGLINDAAAYQGYAYLIVAKGYACMCTVLFDRFEDVHRCFEETTRIFKNLVGLDIQNAKSVGGIGGFALKNVFQSNGRLYVGEAAGIQDFLWGFGLRDAMASGFLAAQSLLEGRSYEEMAKVYFSRKLRASLVNRYLWEKFITRRYFYFMGRVKNAEHGVDLLSRMHRFNLLQRVVYPFALSAMRKKYAHLRI